MLKVVLHAEDESLWRFCVEDLLGSEGIKIISCDSLEEAKEVFASQHFDAIICDGTINAMNDGLEWAAELHEAGHNAIILSGRRVSSKISSKIPYINKMFWSDGGDARLLQWIIETSN